MEENLPKPTKGSDTPTVAEIRCTFGRSSDLKAITMLLRFKYSINVSRYAVFVTRNMYVYNVE